MPPARLTRPNVGRNALRTRLVRMAEQDIAERRNEDAAPLGFADDLRATKQFQSALSAWPAVSPSALVRRLLSSRAALRTAAICRLSTLMTCAACARAISAVRSLEASLTTMISYLAEWIASIVFAINVCSLCPGMMKEMCIAALLIVVRFPRASPGAMCYSQRSSHSMPGGTITSGDSSTMFATGYAQ